MAILTPSYPVSVKVDRCLHVLTLDSVYRSQIAGKCFLSSHYMTQRKPEEKTDDESYNMH